MVLVNNVLNMFLKFPVASFVTEGMPYSSRKNKLEINILETLWMNSSLAKYVSWAYK